MLLKGKKPIAVFSLAFQPFEGGAEIAAREIIRRLGERHFVCFTHQFDSRWPANEKVGNLEIIRLGGFGGTSPIHIRTSDVHNYYGQFWQKIFYVFRAWRAAEHWHRRNNFAVIWAVMASYGGLAALFFKLRHPKMPFLLTLQEGDSEEHILRRVHVFYPLWRLIFRRADYIQAISNYLKDFALRHGARCPIEVVPNGVDLQKFQIPNPKFLRRSDLQNIKTGNFRRSDPQKLSIITTSRLVYKNGVDILIRAFAHIAGNFSSVIPSPPKADEESQRDSSVAPLLQNDLRLMILGDGPDRKNLENLAQSLGVAGKVKFLGQVSPEEIPRYLSQAHVFVRLSRSEGLGSSFLEAMAAGLPVIGTRVGGIPDFLKDRETGLLTRVDNSEDSASKILELLNNEGLRQRLIKNSLQLVRERYNWRLIADSIEGILLRLNLNSEVQPQKRILIATGLFPPEAGGPATYTRILSEELPKRGLGVRILAFREVRQLPKILRHLVFFFKVLRAAKGVQVIFAQDPVSVGVPAALAAKILRRRFILKIVGDYAWEQGVQRFGVQDLLDEFLKKRYGFRLEFLRRLERFTANSASVIIAPSLYLKKVVLSWGVPEQKIRVVYNSFDSVASERTDSAKKSKGEKIIFSAGRLVSWKGFEALIKIMPEIVKKFPGVKLLIAGDGSERKSLGLRIKNYGLEKNVELLGNLERKILFQHLKNADVFALNTGYEGFSHQLLEALALGAPVITTRVGGNPEIIEHEKSGILVGFNEEQELKEAISRVLSDSKLAEKFRTAGFERIKDFALEKMIQETAKILA